MRRGRLAVVAAIFALTAAGVAHSLLSAADRPAIAGVAPGYGPAAPSPVPNLAAILQRIWVPDLDSGFDPQGLAVEPRAIYVSGYRSQAFDVHRGPCVVFRIDPASGRQTGSFAVSEPCGHAGGLALGGDGFLYIADTHTLFAAPAEQAFGPAGPQLRRFALAPGLAGALAASSPDGIWLGSYRESEPGQLFHFTAASLAQLQNGDVLAASAAAAAVAIPDHAQGAAFGDGALWVARSDWNWGTLDRLDPNSGAPLQRYQFAAGVEGIDFDGDGRLWAVSEAGARHYFDHLLLRRIEPFFPLVVALDPSRLQ